MIDQGNADGRTGVTTDADFGHQLQSFVHENKQLWQDGSRFLQELRAIFILELEVSKLAIKRSVVYVIIASILTLVTALMINTVLALALVSVTGLGPLAAAAIVLALDILALVACGVSAATYAKHVGFEHTRELISSTLNNQSRSPDANDSDVELTREKQ